MSRSPVTKFPNPPELINLARLSDSTASQSSTHGNLVASIAIDGITDRGAAQMGISHTLNGGWQWWQLKLGRESFIDRIDIMNRAGGDSRILNAVVTVDEHEVGRISSVAARYEINVGFTGL